MDALDCAGRTPFHSAVENGCPITISKLLLEKAPHHVDRPSAIAGKTVLHYAAENGDAELVALLIQHHARVTVTDANGNTPEMLARGVLSRDKPSKSKAQKYKAAIQHIQKAIAVIQEAQRAKDAILEEQRKKEAEMAREEAEKDMAARRKQEEKLEAAQRRREEEEKELARLKALAADPHGHNSGGGGGGNKKKKKKKGKGGPDVQPVTKERTVSKGAVNHLLDSPVLVNAPSPLGSPAPSRSSSTASPVPPALSPVVSQVAPPKSASTPSTNGPISSTATAAISQSKARSQSPVSPAAPKPNVVVPSPVQKKATQPAIAPSPTIQLRPARTSYRPSQLIVTRMADMGFPQREARKALMQTEGKFEEAIELLTTGAELVDDSEDEAEIAAQETAQEAEKEAARLVAQQAAQQAARDAAFEASRLKAKAAEFVPSTPTSTKQKAVPATSPSNTASGKAAARIAAGDAKSPNTQQSGSSQRQHHASIQKGTVQHPVQILQRTHPVDPQAQMRSVPTQVLQRPHPHTHARSPLIGNALKGFIPTQMPLAPLQGSLPTPTPVNTIPFLPARTQPPQPPTRTPYSYGSAAVQTQSQPTPTPTPASTAVADTPTSTAQTSENLQQTPSIHPTPNIVTGSEYQRRDSGGSLGGIQQHPMIGSVLSEESVAGTWDTQLGVYDLPPSVHQQQLRIDTAGAPSTMQSSLWGASSLLPSPMGSIAARSPNAFQAPLSAIAPTTNQHCTEFQHQRAPPALLAASMDEMLRQSQLDMDLGNADGDMVKDILAMTGAIDPEDLVDSLSGYGGINTGWSDDKPNLAPSLPAVGEGRASATPAGSKNPVASLWGYGAFTQDIVPADKSWSSTPSQRAEQLAGRIPTGPNGFASSTSSSSLEYHNQWNSGPPFHTMEGGSTTSSSLYQQHHHFSSSLPVVPERGGDAQMASFIDNLFGSPGLVHVPASHPPGIGAHSRTGMTPTVSNSSTSSNAYHQGSVHDSFSGYPFNAAHFDNGAAGGGSKAGSGDGYLNSNNTSNDYGMNAVQSSVGSLNSSSRSHLNSLGGDGYNSSLGSVQQIPSSGSSYTNSSMFSPTGSNMNSNNSGYSAFSSASSFSSHQVPSHSLDSMHPGAIGGGRGSISSSSNSIDMGIGAGAVGSGSGFINKPPSPDHSTDSPGIQALNQALAFSRYPKLNTPGSSNGHISGTGAASSSSGHDQGHGATITTTQAPNGAWHHQ